VIDCKFKIMDIRVIEAATHNFAEKYSPLFRLYGHYFAVWAQKLQWEAYLLGLSLKFNF
jgi:hypothetical protein